MPVITPIPGRNPIPGRTPGKTSADQLAATTAKIKAQQNQLATLNKQLKALKKPKSAMAMKAYTRKLGTIRQQIANLNKSLGTLKTTQATQQNKVYQETGQYEKLLKGTERDAYMAVNALFSTYDLGSLAGKIFDYVKNGYSADTISILLQDTKEYKERFAGNEARRKAGLPVLSPGEYLSVESSYRQIMQSAGLPTGFYDTNSDFNQFIGKNLSPSELQARVDSAVKATTLAPPGYRQALKQMGLSEGDMVAYWLDQKKSLPFLTKAAATAAVGAAALSQGLAFDEQYAATLATQGIGEEEARAGYSQIATELGAMKNLGSIYGDQYGQREAEEAILAGKGTAIDKRRRLQSQERGAFSGAAGGARAGLAQRGGAR